MSTTVHTFTDLGFRTMPIGQKGWKLVRKENGKKDIVNAKGETVGFKAAMPPNWTKTYGAQRTEHADTPLGGLICGELSNKTDDEVEVIALDCDNQAAWDMMRAVDKDYLFYFESIDKPGGTILYELSEELRELKQFSVNNGTIHLEYMAKREAGANAMVYLPTTANETKTSIPKGAELRQPPAAVVYLLKSLMPREVPSAPMVVDSAPSSNLPYNAPLVKQFVHASKEAAQDNQVFGKVKMSSLVQKVYKVFTPKKFRAAEEYKELGWLSPDSDQVVQIGPWSEYIVGVSAIAGSDPSISLELYTDFMQAINAQVSDPMPAKRYLDEVIEPMVNQKAQINGRPIWRYDEKWDQNSHTIVNQYGETLEYFTLEDAANRFVEYNHTTKEVVEIQGVRSLRDQIYSKDTDPQQEVPPSSIVKKLKLVRITHSIKAELGVSTNSTGHTILNTAEPVLPLRILRNPELYADTVGEDDLHVQALNLFLNHLMNDIPEAVLFTKQVIAYHAKHLTNIPVIFYIVGVGGAGKSHFANILEALFGSNATAKPSAKQVTSQFNDFLEGTAVLVLSETSDSSPRDREGIKAVLKTVTGERAIDIETKRQALRRNVPVFALPVLLSNDPWYEEDSADRRLFAVMPRTTMTEAEAIREFEQHHGVMLMDLIMRGIKLGVISKYLSTFCPPRLPAVPITVDRTALANEQADPVVRVKSLIEQSAWTTLFDLFEEHSIEEFFWAMENKRLTDKDAIYKQQLVSLCSSLREGGFYPTDAEIARAFGPRWMPKHVVQYRPRDNMAKEKLGYVKWRVPIAEPYNEWKVRKMLEDEE